MPEGDEFKYIEAEMVPTVYPYMWGRTPLQTLKIEKGISYTK